MQSVNIIDRIDPIKITISGNYYDCQIYRGRLYVWSMSGSIDVYDWNKLLNRIVIPKFSIRLPFVFGFMEGNFLYDKRVSYIFSEKEYYSYLLTQYNNLLKDTIEITSEELSAVKIMQTDIPFGELPTDTEVYANNIYFAVDSGIFRRVIHSGETDKAIGPKDTKLWDCRILSLRANKYPQIALSAGSEGLYELNLVKDDLIKPKAIESISDTNIYKISSKPSSFSNYSFLSIFSSSYVEESFLALFNWKPLNSKIIDGRKAKVYRDFDNLIDESKIFGKNKASDICLGIDDKIYRIEEDYLYILKFSNSINIQKGENLYQELNSIKLPKYIGRIIGAGVSYFGIVLEFTNGILVLRSDGNITTIPKEVIRWRIYPRSKNYLNHLHLIFNDRLEIYSFNHDSLVNQHTKSVGLEYVPDDSPIYQRRNTEENQIVKEMGNISDEIKLQSGNFKKFTINDSDTEFPF